MDIHKPPLKTIALRIAKWGNSLAVRLPVEYVRQTSLVDGDMLILSQAPDGTLSLVPRKPFDRAAFAARLRRQTDKMKMGSPVVEQLRRDARY